MTAQAALAVCSFILALIAAVTLSTLSVALARYASTADPIHLARDRRALKLLKDWLSPEQLACFERYSASSASRISASRSRAIVESEIPKLAVNIGVPETR